LRRVVLSAPMTQLPADIVELIEGDKLLGEAPLWNEKADPEYEFFTAALTVGAVATGGFQLRVKVSKKFVHRDAIMQLEYAPAGRRSAMQLWRLDWKRFHTHDNDGLPPEHAFESYPGSHQHPFFDNFIPAELRMRGSNLRAGRPFPKEPNTLSDFLALGGELFKIKDIRLVSLPVIGPDIFWREDD